MGSSATKNAERCSKRGRTSSQNVHKVASKADIREQKQRLATNHPPTITLHYRTIRKIPPHLRWVPPAELRLAAPSTMERGLRVIGFRVRVICTGPAREVWTRRPFVVHWRSFTTTGKRCQTAGRPGRKSGARPGGTA